MIPRSGSGARGDDDLDAILHLDPRIQPGQSAREIALVKGVLRWQGFLEETGGSEGRSEDLFDLEAAEAIGRYQEFYDLDVTRRFNPPTIRSLTIRRCALTPLSVRGVGDQCLEKRSYACRIVGGETFRKGAALAIHAWNSALREARIPVGFNVVATGEGAEVLVATEGPGSFPDSSWGRADLPSGCPDLDHRERRAVLNSASGWSVSGSGGTTFSALYGYLHELGHVLGLGDICSSRSVMCNSVRNAIRNPAKADIDRIGELYS